MRKSGERNKKKSQQPQGDLAEFFLPKEQRERVCRSLKMADDTSLTENDPAAEVANLFKSEFEAFKSSFQADLMGHLSNLLKPITEKLDAMAISLAKTAQTANKALEISSSVQSEIRTLHLGEDILHERLVTLDLASRQFNLKFRGVPENEESTKDLATFMAHWLAKELNLEEELYPIVKKAYRLGIKNNPKREGPRDIVIILSDYRTRQAILNESRSRGHFLMKDSKILIFPDLPPEALQKKRELKPITQALLRANIRFRWATPLKLSVRYKGSNLTASDEESGRLLLQTLGIDSSQEEEEEEMEEEKKSYKRKHHPTSSPFKDSKIPVRHFKDK